jgi:hypothetical protein
MLTDYLLIWGHTLSSEGGLQRAVMLLCAIKASLAIHCVDLGREAAANSKLLLLQFAQVQLPRCNKSLHGFPGDWLANVARHPPNCSPNFSLRILIIRLIKDPYQLERNRLLSANLRSSGKPHKVERGLVDNVRMPNSRREWLIWLGDWFGVLCSYLTGSPSGIQVTEHRLASLFDRRSRGGIQDN